MTPPDEHDRLLDFARGDRARAESLRENLRAVRARTDDPDVRRAVDRALAGELSVRELARQPAFERELDRGMERFSQWWGDLSPQERAEAVRAGQRQEAERRVALGEAPPVEAPAEVGDSPLLRDDQS